MIKELKVFKRTLKWELKLPISQRKHIVINNLINKTIVIREAIRKQKTREIQRRIELAHNKWFNNKRRKLKNLYDQMKRIKRGNEEEVIILNDQDEPIYSPDELKSEMVKLWETIFNLGTWPEADMQMARLGLTNSVKQTQRQDMDDLITIGETEKAIRRLRNGTSAGSTNIPPECIKEWPMEMIQYITIMFNKWYEQAFFPELGKLQAVTLLHKKGPKTKIKNYRTLSLGCNISKIYLTILTKRIEKTAEEANIMGNIQNGFRANHRIEDCLLTLQHIVHKAKMKGKTTKPFMAFLDICKAYDRVWRDALWAKMIDYGYSQKLVTAVKATYESPKAKISFQGITTSEIGMPVGLRQGCTMSPILFALYLADLGKSIEKSGYGIDIGLENNTENVSGIFFADDMLLIAESEQKMQKLLDIVGKWAAKSKTEFSGEKSMVIPIRTPCDPNRKWRMGTKWLNERETTEITIADAQKAKYLGVQISQKYWDILKDHKNSLPNKLETKIWKTIIPAANTARKILYGTKIWNIYTIPQVTHGTSAMILGKLQLDRLVKIERDFQRRLLNAPTYTANMALYGETDIIPIDRVIKRNTINYYYHLRKLSNTRTVKRAIEEQLEWKITRPNIKTWAKNVETYIREINFNEDTLQSKMNVKIRVKNLWLEEFKREKNLKSTLRYYKDVPNIDTNLYVTEETKWWLKAKMGIMINPTTRRDDCPRCQKSYANNITHQLWECNDNKRLLNSDPQLQNALQLINEHYDLGILMPNKTTFPFVEKEEDGEALTRALFADDIAGPVKYSVGLFCRTVGRAVRQVQEDLLRQTPDTQDGQGG